MSGKKGTHYRAPRQKKPFMSKKDWIIFGVIVCAAAVIALTVYLVNVITDDRIKVSNGELQCEDDTVLTCPSRTKQSDVYSYGKFDFHQLEGYDITYGENTYRSYTRAYKIRPEDGRFREASINATYKQAEALANDVIPTLQETLGDEGEVDPLKKTSIAGHEGYLLYYTGPTSKVGEDGYAIKDADGNDIREYKQVFLFYIPVASREGCIAVMLTYTFDTKDLFVKKEEGFRELETLLSVLTTE